MRRLITIVFILFVMTGCKKDFLQQTPTNAVSDESAFKTIDDIKLALKGCYEKESESACNAIADHCPRC